jgi:hypothetical protein
VIAYLLSNKCSIFRCKYKTQSKDLSYLIPLTLNILDDNTFSEGDYYCSDLLEALLRTDIEFWIKNDIYKSDIENIIERNIDDLQSKLFSFRNKFNYKTRGRGEG